MHGHAQHFQAVGLGFFRRAAAVQAHHHVDATVLEVQRMGMALGAITDRDGLAVEQTEIGVGIVKGWAIRAGSLSWGNDRAYANGGEPLISHSNGAGFSPRVSAQ